MQRVTVLGVSMENFDALKDAQAIGKALLQKSKPVFSFGSFWHLLNY